ncbi:hypothetical protein Cgig2_017991 [Carnegiea gigantea]|uniref:Protein kinase domain-containing protein n=1 Tax=Carnegiea gigantea TaxID=171969 RepID=A0A9Q1JRU1_9CARY|nr:hypothetical protein Cgig2_017991 [Carnegiea gigantea]
MMDLRTVLFLALVCIHVQEMAADTNDRDCENFEVMLKAPNFVADAALKALTRDWGNLPNSWTGVDPCGSRWEGVTCSDSRVITITLSSMNLTGELTGDLASLSELEILDLSSNKGLTGSLPSNIGQLSKLTTLILYNCDFSGSIPDSVGSLKQLVHLSLYSNRFIGPVPASIGDLKNLYWLDLSNNQLTGSIPVSNGTAPGLDLLVKTKHFHFGMNQLSGPIPPGLFRPDMVLIHVLFDNNNLTGSIPSTLGLVKTLETVRFDRNQLSGPLPTNLNNLTNCNELVLSNNAFTDFIPDLTGMNNLNRLDMSNNSFSPSDGIPPWFSTLQSLTTVMMERTELEGELPAKFFSFPQLETVVMRNNRLNGTLEFGNSYSRQLQLIDLHNNSIESVKVSAGYKFTLMLADNPFCRGIGANLPYCSNQEQPGSMDTSPELCVPLPCSSDQISSPKCKCAFPYTGTFILRAPSFSLLGGQIHIAKLKLSLEQTLPNLALPVDSVLLTDAYEDNHGYLNMPLAIFPSRQNHFNRTGMFSLAFVLSNQTYKPPEEFGPYIFIANSYTHFGGKKNSSRTGLIVGAAVGCSLLFLLLLSAAGYAYRQKKRVEKAKHQGNPFESWDSHGVGGDIPALKGARFFTFEELQICTNNFSEGNSIGSGGYGKVYKGFLADGQIIAIKRSQEGSLQGSREFKNEIELLSRVHHKNLVNLVGFCFDQGEQMLVYEFIPNGTLMDCLSGNLILSQEGLGFSWIGNEE